MAGVWTKLFQQDFASTATVTVTHNTNRIQVALMVQIGGVIRNDLIESIVNDSADPRNVVVLTLTSSQSGSVIIADSDFAWANLPSPEESAQLGAAVHLDVADEFAGITEKLVPVAGDIFLIEDFADARNKKYIQVGNLPSGTSGITVEDDGGTVSGGPHTTLNFIGIDATDAGGGVADITSTAIQESIVDAKGDLLVATAADTVVRLPVGSNRQILRADNTQAEGVVWISEDQAIYADYYDSGTTDVGSNPTTLSLDTSRQSNAAFVLSSDTVTVQAGGGGDYFIRYDVTFGETDSSNRECECWVEINGTEVPATRSVFSHWDEHGLTTDDTAGRSAIITLAASDVIRLRGDVTNGSSGYTTDTGGVSLQIMSIGSNGPAGPQGPAGSGSTITVQDDGSTVSGGPHSTLNFVGISATDAGSGVATITSEAVFGNNYQETSELARTTTTSTSFQTKLTLTTPFLTGTYRISWMAVVDQTNTGDKVETRLQNTTSGSTVGATQIHEPKDARNRIFVGGFSGIVFTSSSKTFEIQWRQQGGNTAGIQNAIIEIWRVS